MTDDLAALRFIKLLHTAAWAFFASAILTIPIAAWVGAWRVVLVLIGIVMAECIVVGLNGMKCPLTPVAARYTADRSDNFDIYLPVWLARHNKTIFGALFVANCLFAAALQSATAIEPAPLRAERMHEGVLHGSVAAGNAAREFFRIQRADDVE